MVLQSSVQRPLNSKVKFPIDFDEHWSACLLFPGVPLDFNGEIVIAPPPQPWEIHFTDSLIFMCE